MNSFVYGIDRGGSATAAAGHGKDVGLGAVAAEAGGQYAARAFATLKYCSARAIAEEYARIAIFPIDD